MKITISTKIARLAGTALAALALMGSALTAEAAAFMKLGDIKGEATDSKHKEWIEVLSISQSVVRGEGLTGQSRRRGDVIMEDIVCVKELDKSSPKLAESVCTGKVFPKVEIEMTATYTNADGTDGRVTYYKYELTNVMVTSYTISGSAQGAEVPTEQFSLNFEEIRVIYTKQGDAAGNGGGNVEYPWKVEEGTK